MRLWGLALVLGLGACGSGQVTVRESHIEPVGGPDGSPGWFAVDCWGSKSHCLRAAGRVCPDGYQTTDSDAQRGSQTASVAYVEGSRDWATGRASSRTDPTYHGSILIHCQGRAMRIVPGMDLRE